MSTPSTPSKNKKAKQTGVIHTPAAPQQPSTEKSLVDAPSNITGGGRALAAKAASPYSNKQFIAPFKFQINVEGALVTVDYLGKKIVTNNAQPYRALVSLSAQVLPEAIINDPFAAGTGNRKVKSAPASKAAAQQFTTGAQAINSSLGGRLTQFSSANQSTSTQTPSLLQGTGINNALGALQSQGPTSTLAQSVANLPGFTFVKDSLGLIPSVSNLSQTLSNPTAAIGVASGIAQTLSKDLNFQNGLPSVSLGSLGSVFSTASDLANSGPPTSLTGLISLEKQIKAIICNFKLPTLTIPAGFPGSITNTFQGFDLGAAISQAGSKVQTALSDIGKQIEKEFQDTVSAVKNEINVVKQLAQSLPPFDSIYRSAIKELTTCTSNPSTQNQVKSGQPSATPPPAPNISPVTPLPPETGYTVTVNPDTVVATGNGSQTNSIVAENFTSTTPNLPAAPQPPPTSSLTIGSGTGTSANIKPL